MESFVSRNLWKPYVFQIPHWEGGGDIDICFVGLNFPNNKEFGSLGIYWDAKMQSWWLGTMCFSWGWWSKKVTVAWMCSFCTSRKFIVRSNYSWGPWHHFASLFVLAGLIFTDQLGNVNVLSNISSFVCLVFSSIRWIYGSTLWRECSGRLWKPIVLSRTKNRYNTMHWFSLTYCI